MKTFKSLSLLLLVMFVLTSCQKDQVSNNTLPESTPEAEGVSSSAITTFLDSASVGTHEFHGFVFLRHGKVIARGWWDPYKPEYRHTLYSTSKSFTSTAVGFAVSENKLSVNDTVISFFMDDLPDTISEFLKGLRVRDLLSMSAGMVPDPTGAIVTKDTNWVKGFLSTPILNEPGTKFLYNSMATYMLSAIVQKVTGENVLDYLTPRLFEPLGIKEMDWEEDLHGINTGGWGLRLHTEDMAKFGQLLLQQGKWNGRQIIPKAWINEATTFKIEQQPDALQSKKDSSDWLQGYCYQFWRCRHNAFRADGAYGQFIIVMPDQDAVIAINSESPDMQDELNLVWKYLLPAMQKDKMAANPESLNTLKDKLSSLAVLVPGGSEASPLVNEISGKKIVLEANERKLEELNANFDSSTCNVHLKIDGNPYELRFGQEKWVTGETNKPAPNLVELALENRSMLLPAKYAGWYTWTDNNTFELILRYLESAHSEKFICHFAGNKMQLEYSRSQDFDKKTIAISGKILK